MSLLDALLLEAPKLEVYIALRNDPARGTGTEADPFSGNTVLAPTVYSGLTVTSVTLQGVTTATVTFNHPYQLGDVVTISGASSVPDNTPYNGEFLITQVVPGVSFQYVMTKVPANNSVSGLSCVMEGHLFDSVMRSLPADVPVAVHIGPGLFETRGYSKYRDGVSWRPRSGMKILGSGIGVTTLQLVGGVGANVYYSVIGVPPLGTAFTPLDSFEACGMTLDCNIAGQTSSQLTCGAVFVRGKHTRLRRLRVINFGRQGDRDASPECFALGVCGAEIGRVGGTDQMLQQPNCVVEECIVERPGLNSVKETTCIAGLGGDAGLVYPNRGVIGTYHLAFQVRNCYIDCDFQVNPVSIETIVETPPGSGIYQITTRTSHGLVANQVARISGLRDNQDGFNSGFNGSFEVTDVTDRTFKYVPEILPGTLLVDTPERWVGRFPSQYVGISTVWVTHVAGDNYLVRVRTQTAHYLVTGSVVAVNEVKYVEGDEELSWVGNGIREATYQDSREFTFELVHPGGAPPTPTGFTTAFIGVTYQGVSIDGGASAVMEGNCIANCRYGGPYHDTFSTKDCVCRNNHYRSVVVGVLHSMDKGETSTYVPKFDVAAALQGGAYITHVGTTATFQSVTQTGVFTDWEVTIEGARILGQDPPAGTYNGYYSVVSPSNAQNQFTYVMPVTPSANADGSGTVPAVSGDLLPHAASLTHVGNLATFTVASDVPHGFTVGQGIQITDAQENQLPAEPDTYNGYFAIESVPTPTSFTYRMINIPSFNADAKPGAKVNVLHQIQECVVENNVFELLPTINDFGQHVAVGLYAYPRQAFRAFPVFRRVVIRGNIVRLLEDRLETAVKALAIDLHFCEQALVEDNIVDLPTPNPLRNQNNVASTSVNYFNNRDSNGKLIQGASVGEIAGTPVTTMVTEVTTTVEDALMLGLL